MKSIVTCDIVKSRKYSTEQRKELNSAIENRFKECCELIPEADADRFSFSIVQGDEFQILVNNPAYSYQFTFFFRIIISLTPIKPSFRAGIGIGEVHNYDNHLYRMDGPAFHHSRDAMNLYKIPAYSDRITTMKAGDETLVTSINLILNYNDFLEQKCSMKQKEAMYLYKKHGSLKQVAINSDVSYQALQQRLRTAGFKQMSRGNDTLSKLIKSRLNP